MQSQSPCPVAARRLIRETIGWESVDGDELAILSDREPAMMSHSVARLLATLAVGRTQPVEVVLKFASAPSEALYVGIPQAIRRCTQIKQLYDRVWQLDLMAWPSERHHLAWCSDYGLRIDNQLALDPTNLTAVEKLVNDFPSVLATAREEVAKLENISEDARKEGLAWITDF